MEDSIRFNVRGLDEYYEVHILVTDPGGEYWSALTDNDKTWTRPTQFDDYVSALQAMRKARDTYPTSKLRVVSYTPEIEREFDAQE